MDKTPIIQILRVRPDKDPDIPLPKRMTPLSAGMDIFAAVESDIILQPGDITLIPTGYAVAIPPGFEAQIRPRSGLAFRYGIGLINSPGTIDADYRGEIQIPVIHLGKEPYTLRRGDRIAQMVIHRCYPAELKLVTKLDETDRNAGGFGHTGT